MHGRAEVRGETEAVGLQLVVHLAHLQHLRVVRSRRRVDLVAELLVVLLGQRQQAAQQLLAVRADHDLLEAERVRGLQLTREEVVLLVGRHVALLAATHVEVRADRAGLESVAIHAVAPELDELVVDVGVGAQHLGDVELDAGAESVIGRSLDEGLGRVEPRGELGGERVEGDPELDPGAGDAVVFSHDVCFLSVSKVGGSAADRLREVGVEDAARLRGIRDHAGAGSRRRPSAARPARRR